MKRVLVIGAGIAGAAAAWAARARGARVCVTSHRAGASELCSGALDFHSWQQPHAAQCALPECLLSFASALGTWQLPTHGALVISSNGVLRPARGFERGLLDLSTLAGREIGVPDVERPDWDAVRLCKFLARDATVQRLGLRFIPVRVPMLRETAEQSSGSADLAARHDASERVEWLIEKLGRHGLDAWLLGPWLGTVTPRSQDVSHALGVPVGEALSDVGEAAGMRTSAAIERLLAQAGVERQHLRLDQLLPPDAEHPCWRGLSSAAQPWRADAVVVACGGLAAGGVVVKRSRRGAPGGAGLALNFSADLLLEYNGQLVDQASSLHGVDFEHGGRALVEGLGVGVCATSPQPSPPLQAGHQVAAPARPAATRAEAAFEADAMLVAARRATAAEMGSAGSAASSVFVAGDVRAGGPRSMLFAAYTGICAGNAAARAIE